jgi:hypothetical protein
MALAQEVVWVNELESDATLIGRQIVVEGRFSGRVGRDYEQIKLHNSKVEFHLPREQGKQLPAGLRYVRLTGKLTRSGDKLVMQIASLAKIPTTDVDRFNDAASQIDSGDHAGWERLAARTEGLADFYGDSADAKELRELAQKARVRAFRAKESALRPGQAAELLALADSAGGLGLAETEARRMRHKALRWRFDALAGRPASADDWRNLADQIAKLLPGARTELRPSDETAAERYQQGQQVELYERSSAPRNAYDRTFWLTASAAWLSAEAAKPAADLFDLSARAKLQMPERPELWRKLLERGIESESRKLATLPTSQVRRLAEMLRRDLGRPDRAEDLIRQWLDAQRHKLGKQDVERRYELARQYRTELNDAETAAKLLMEAVEILPDYPPAQRELAALGYEKGASGWTRRPATSAAGPAAALAARQRVPRVGMTPEEVRQLIGEPRPGDVVRVGMRDQIVEQWAYREPTPVYVSFSRSGGTGLRVIAVVAKPRN